MPITFTNFAYSQIAVGISAVDTTIAVTGGHGARFPALGVGEYFYATIENASFQREIVRVTARATDSLTVVRGEDNTTAQAWLAGDSIALRFNAAAVEAIRDESGAVLLSGDQVVAGVKTFSSPIAGSVTGSAASVTGTVAVANGGTGQTTAATGFDALKQPATDTYAGVSELATAAEFLTGTSTSLVPPVSVIRNGIINIGTTVASTSGTLIDYTDISAWVKEVNVFFDGFSTNGASIPIVQLGDAGGFENTGYSGSMANMGSAAVSTVVPMSSGFSFAGAMAAGVVIHGTMTLRRSDESTNKWSAVFIGGRSDAANGLAGGGTKTLSGPLTQIRITTEGGVNTFDLGSVNRSMT